MKGRHEMMDHGEWFWYSFSVGRVVPTTLKHHSYTWPVGGEQCFCPLWGIFHKTHVLMISSLAASQTWRSLPAIADLTGSCWWFDWLWFLFMCRSTYCSRSDLLGEPKIYCESCSRGVDTDLIFPCVSCWMMLTAQLWMLHKYDTTHMWVKWDTDIDFLV